MKCYTTSWPSRSDGGKVSDRNNGDDCKERARFARARSFSRSKGSKLSFRHLLIKSCVINLKAKTLNPSPGFKMSFLQTCNKELCNKHEGLEGGTGPPILAQASQ